MNKQKQVLENTFKQTFDMGRFVEFSTEFFNGVEIVAPNKIKDDKWNWSEFSVFIDGYFHVANYVDPEKNKIAILAVKLKKDKSVEKARSMQRNFVAKLLSVGNLNGAIVAFYSSEDTKWRLSFVKLEMEYLKGKVGKKITPAKRYSYLVGEKEPCHTAMNRLLPIFENEQFNPTLAQIEEAFSVEVVTKAFFEQYKQKYIELKEYLEQNECFIRQGEKHGFTAEQFAKKLMGQLAFLYFLQKKGWMGVKAIKETLTEKQYKDAFFLNAITRSVVPKIYIKVADDKYQRQIAPLNALDEKEEFALACGVAKCADAWGTGSRTYMRDIFDYSTKIKCNYFDDILEPLFYEALNKKREASDYYCKLHCRIPFLNGGLFEPFGDDWGNNDFDIPNEMFSERPAKDFETANGILDIFDRYNFTINEDEPLEREVAVDPEMLGKIFENLLDVKDRKSKGAFYTPREIVHYMCQESLINYLVNEVGAPYEDIKQFILYGEILKDEDTSRESKNGVSVRQLPESVYNKLHEIDKALENVKVADPAVGSGAFPMGMVSEICKARNNITSYMSLKLKNSYDKRVLFNETRNPYLIKKETLLNCIFAVDIEPSAIDITKLRLWLSLVVEQDIDDLNKNPYPLPNLDCNIMCGNSLIDEFEGRKLFDENILTGETSANFADMALRTETEKLFNKMFEAQRELFYANDHLKKEELKNTIKKYIDIMVGMQLKDASQKVRDDYEIAKNMASTPFFLWKLQFAKVFKEKGGFDIVIGNPPYVGHKGGQKQTFHDIKLTYLGQRFNNERMDLFYYFYHLGLDLSNAKGLVGYITTNYFITADSGKKLRLDIKMRSNIIRLINFNECKIFESAMGQHNMICLLSKNQNGEKCNIVNVNRKGYCSNILNKILSETDNQTKYYSVCQKDLFDESTNNIIFRDSSNINNLLLESIIKKMKAFKALNTLCNISQGIVSGMDKVGEKHLIKPHVGDFTKGEGVFVINNNEKEQNFSISNIFIKPWYKNSDIEKYATAETANQFLVYMNTDYDLGMNEEIDKHLLKFEELIRRRNYDSGELSKAKKMNKWWAMSSSRKEFNFSSPKIVAPQRCLTNKFGYNEIEWYASADVYFINDKNNDVSNLKYVLAILNSKLIYLWLYNQGKRKGDMLELYLTPLSEIPIPIISNDKRQPFIVLADKIIDNKKNGVDTALLEQEIDQLVYELYGLTEEEIAIVEGKNE